MSTKKTNRIKKTVNPAFIYIFFLVHSLFFSASGFFLFYRVQDPEFGFLHGGIAIMIYLGFYLDTFGKEAIKNMLIGAFIGTLQIYSWLELIGSTMMDGNNRYKTFSELPLYFHIVPGIYFILYTFLLKNAMIDLLRARGDAKMTDTANKVFYVLSGILFILPSFL